MATAPVPHGTVIRADCRAKVNLLLRILAREDSGYHQIETLFCAVGLADELDIAVGEVPGIHLETAMPGDRARNLTVLAAEAFCEATGIAPVHRLRLVKRIPVGAGLGGGSSDAAAVLTAMNALHGRPLSDEAILRLAAGLGSDVPFFAAGDPLALGWGRGERLLPLPPLASRPILLAVPDFASSTAAAYAALAESRTGRALSPKPARYDLAVLSTWEGAASTAANDFEPVIFARHPVLAEIRDGLRAAGAQIALLSGSGSVVFGVFDRDAARDEAADRIAAAYPDLRLLRTTTMARPVDGPRPARPVA